MADLQGKYQKLATEYAKLRAQLPVLKKAVLEEQAKEENLREDMKEKDQTIRKFEQEIDSLTFRNQQLASRVAVLQQELEDNETKGKKQKGMKLFHKTSNSTHKNQFSEPAVSSTGANVIGEELHSKIEENARLHKQVYESNMEHEQVLNTLRDRLTILESEAAQHANVSANLSSQNQERIDKLQEEKAMIEVRLQRQEKEYKEALHRAGTAEERLKTLEKELSGELSEAKLTIKDKLPFNDTKLKQLNALNVPTHDRRHQQRVRELVGQAAGLVKEMEQALSNYHTYSEQRTRAYPADADHAPLSDTNKRLCHHLLENATHLRPLEQAFRAFQEGLRDDALTTLETAVGLQDFASKFHKYVTYSNKLLPYQLLSIEEECSVSSCTKTLELKNMELHDCLKRFAAALSKVDSYTALLALQSTANCDQPKSNYPKLFLLLSQAMADFHESAKELSKVYNSKVSLEHQLPTASQKLKTTDECIVSSLISLVTCLNKLSTFLSANLDFFAEKAGYRTRGSSVNSSDVLEGARSNPVVGDFRQRTANYMTSLARPRPDSVPYRLAVHNRTTLLSSTESRESLSQQVDSFHTRVSRLEQEKEHWMLEAQLLQMKFEKEKMRSTDLENQINKTMNHDMGVTALKTDNNKARSNSGSCWTDTSMLGSLETTRVAGESDGDLREQLIKGHFTQRITELTSQLQTADSKALHFHAECRALHKRLALSDREKKGQQEEVSAAMQTVAQLKDELQTTTRSYEDQLSMMSEHLAGMNEKLTTQKDEIDMLKYQLQNPKGGGKKRGK